MTNKVHYSTPENQEYFFDEGCHILEILNDPIHNDLSIARARVESGVETDLHALSETIERYVIISGQGLATIDGVKYSVKENDVIVIGKDVSQKIRNTTESDLVFLAICTPRFIKDCYQEI
jgi:mannose-6-phosphate isomerase-like protein (cupin superfamily)